MEQPTDLTPRRPRPRWQGVTIVMVAMLLLAAVAIGLAVLALSWVPSGPWRWGVYAAIAFLAFRGSMVTLGALIGYREAEEAARKQLDLPR